MTKAVHSKNNQNKFTAMRATF